MRTKLVGFDWDGTLVKMPERYSWNLINKGLDCEREMKEIEDRYFANEIDYLTWCSEDVEVYKRFGLTKRKLGLLMEKGMAMHKGAIETINELKSRGIKVGIISGGIENTFEYATMRFGLKVDYFNFTAKLNFDDKTGKLVSGEFNEYDFDGKLDLFKIYCEKAGAKLDETLYVGDSRNDLAVFKASNGVAFCSDSDELKKHAKHVISHGDMRELLAYVK